VRQWTCWQSTSVVLVFCQDVVDFIASCCGFFDDIITAYCLRMNINFLQGIANFSFLDDTWCIHDTFHEFPLLRRLFTNVEFEFWYLKNWRSSLHRLRNDFSVCPMYFFLQSGHINWWIPRLLNLSFWFRMPRFSLQCY
jgi:hypothetical protein